ncbi:siphovirus Gp157 family protein [Limosilactobacillus fermentum]|uniref:siphovirus Gp157 family protein n=1 Tax=Limosilactobacillus fermentum TaxID=1613 RepID=UPI0021A904D9|nr:siphovirus Gp157 family protein [Limosilactobacillus fermentum]MCT2870672.1 hypothetical protein [Limosilactobacillus fermentum]
MKTNEIISAIAVVNAKRDAGEIDEDIWRDTIEAIDGELEDKLDAMEHVMESYENDLAVLQKEEERRKEAVKNKKSVENRIKNFKRFMGYFLEASGKKKVTTDSHIYTLYHYKPMVYVDPDVELSEEYIKTMTYTQTSPDNDKLRKAIEDGKTVKGVRLLPNNQARVK